MKLEETRIKGVYSVKRDQKTRFITRNYVPGVSVYGEPLLDIDNSEYRIWDPHRSKFAAALASGMKKLPQIRNKSILYLGVSTGTTASHFSDAIIPGGIVYGVEFAVKAMRRFTRLAEQRPNLIPILADARNPGEYSMFVFEADLIYQDLSQPEQASIFGRNVIEYLKPQGVGILALKSQSINVAIEPDEVFSQQMAELEQRFGLEIMEYISIDKFAKKHAMVVVRNP
ncbi:MAG: fibrillarin-like rRNA/tRNA 2'-O-methyltransferase [Candidatus Heimdallarchaeota archaeon]